MLRNHSISFFHRGRSASFNEENPCFGCEDFLLIYIVYLLGVCPHLAVKSGKCKIENDKPNCCREAEPGNFKLCVL